MMARFWLVMTAKYGQKWTSQFTEETIEGLAKDEWTKMLSGFSMDQIKVALDKVIDVHPSWPPTVGEFKKLLTGDTETDYCNPILGIEYKRPEKPLNREERLSIAQRFGAGLRHALNRDVTTDDQEALK